MNAAPVRATEPESASTPRSAPRLYSLDAVRGLAALSVVIFHWQLWGRTPPSSEAPSLLASLGHGFLEFFYRCGGSAVGLFFVLSGFVFHWLFRDKIQAGRVGGKAFAIDRFSRLYPLFVATLLWAWGGHNLYAWMNQGPNWNPGVNNFSGFVQQLLVVPLWFQARVIGFNLPSWSLPIEAMMYALFFVMARRRLLHLGGTVAALLLAIALSRVTPDISDAMTSFFMGGLAWRAFERLPGVRLEPLLRILLGVSWPLAVVLGAGVVDLARTRLAFLDHYYAIYVLYPATVLYLATLERRIGPIAKGWAWFGDATYAMYLLHYPLMLTTAIAFRATGGDFARLQSPISLALFVAILVPLSVGCHRFFERPVQAWIRRRA